MAKKKRKDFIEEMQKSESGSQEGAPKKKKSSQAAAVTVFLLLALLASMFLSVTARSALLPGKFLLLAGGAVAVLVLLAVVLVWDPKRRLPFALGLILTLVLSLVLGVGVYTVMRVRSTLGSITTPTVEVTDISVFVRQDDPAQSLEEIKDYDFGFFTGTGRESEEKSVQELNDQLGAQISVTGYESLPELADALLGGEIGAALIDKAYLEILSEAEDYADIVSQLREITTLRVETVKEPPAAPPAGDGEQKNDGVITLYISGIDSRGGLNVMSRSDVNILAVANTQTNQVLLVSTPRDFYVPTAVSNGSPDKLTHAGLYGVDVSMQTIGMLYGVDVDYYFKVNFVGFEQIIDSLGGITVNSKYAFSTYGYPSYSFSVGENQLNGEQALAFARERKAFATGDNQRGKNQMEVIRSVIKKLQSPELLKNYSSILSAAEGSFETSVPYEMIAGLVRDQLSKGGDWNVVTYSVTGEGASRISYSTGTYSYVMIPYQDTVDTAKELIGQVIDGETVSDPGSSDS